MKRKGLRSLALAVGLTSLAPAVWGCASTSDGKIEVEIVQYKPEAANYFKTVEDAFNASHDDIHLTISSPNDAMAILKTRFIREDYPDIIGIGGDINYSYFVDADILADISGYEGMQNVNEGKWGRKRSPMTGSIAICMRPSLHPGDARMRRYWDLWPTWTHPPQ